jgi:hypothetical protein
MALGIAEERTVLVTLGRDVSLFSDVGGLHYVGLDNGYEMRNLLRNKVRAAGCDPDMATDAQLSRTQAGDFEGCVRLPGQQPPADPFPPPVAAPKKRAGGN